MILNTKIYNIERRENKTDSKQDIKKTVDIKIHKPTTM
jgi:hypothetical protein